MASADGTAVCVYRQWFLEVFLGPFSNVNDRIMTMSDAVSSEGLKITGIQHRSSALSLTHKHLSCDLCSIVNKIVAHVIRKSFSFHFIQIVKMC